MRFSERLWHPGLGIDMVHREEVYLETKSVCLA